MKRLALLTALILAPLTAGAVEFPIDIVNGDFELQPFLGDLPPGTFELADFSVPDPTEDTYFVLPLAVPNTGGAVTFGWDLIVHGDPAALVDPFQFAVPVLSPGDTYNPGEFDGHVGGIFIRDDADVGAAYLWQTTAHNLLPDTRYRLSVDVGNIQSPSSDLWSFDGFPGYAISIGAANQKLAFDEDSVTIEPGEFETVTITVDTPSASDLLSTGQLGEPVFIYLMHKNEAHPGTGVGIPANEVNFDNVILTYESLKDIAEEEAAEKRPSPADRKLVLKNSRSRTGTKSIR